MASMKLSTLFIVEARAVPKAVALCFSRIRNDEVSTPRTFGMLSWNVFLQRTLYPAKIRLSTRRRITPPTLSRTPSRTTRNLCLCRLDYNWSDLENDMALKVGDPAPDFELPAIAGERQITMRSRDYLGRQNLVVAFHPLDWTPT